MSVKNLVETMISEWLSESDGTLSVSESIEESLNEEGFVTVVKNGSRGYLPRWKKRKGDDWKDYRISHFPDEKSARDWLKKDNPEAEFVKEDLDEDIEEGYRVIAKSMDDDSTFKSGVKDTEKEANMLADKMKKAKDRKKFSMYSDVKVVKESLSESDYKVMHKTFTDAVNTAKEKAEKAGYTIDDDEWFRKVSSGPRKPGTDKTNKYSIELMTKKGNPAKKYLQIQVYNTGNAYELNTYIN
jgi:hypothetical protein